MENSFFILIKYNSKEINLPAEFIQFGYSYKIAVDVFGTTISFERDEEQNFRAIISYEDLATQPDIDKGILQAIAEKLTLLFAD